MPTLLISTVDSNAFFETAAFLHPSFCFWGWNFETQSRVLRVRQVPLVIDNAPLKKVATEEKWRKEMSKRGKKDLSRRKRGGD